MHKVQNAIIVAAGKGERMLPITSQTPKPLIPIHGKPIIENTIEILINKGIAEIYIVIGYLAEQFQYLKEKYPVHLIMNPHYNTCNNISSLYCVKEHLGDSVILDADIWITNDDIIQTEFEYSGYTGIWTSEECNEWIQTVDENDFLISCCRSGANGWILYSISYWTQADCETLRQDLETEFIMHHNREIYWDDIPIFCYPHHYHLQVKKTMPGCFVEFDDVKELAVYDKSYLKYINE